MTEFDRRDFLRRTGALGISGAAALGFSLRESRIAGAAPLPAPRDVIAAGGGATIRIGHLDGFTGVYAQASQAQQVGMELAVEQAEKKNSRIKYLIIKGDDQSKVDAGEAEARRLIASENVDVLAGCLSSAVALSVSSIAQQAGIVFMAIPHDTNITGAKAHRVTFRQTCSIQMLVNVVGPALLNIGKKWQFITADYAFGNDAQSRFEKLLTSRGGTMLGNAVHPLGMPDFKDFMSKLAYTSADVLVFCNYGPDTQKATQAAVDLGFQHKMHFGGVLCANDVAEGMPTEQLAGSTWGYIWGPDAGGRTTQPLYRALKAKTESVSWRHYLGYMAAKNLIDVMNLAGSNETPKIIKALEGHRYDAAKVQPAYFRACDHQAVQQVYAASILPNPKRLVQREYFAISNSLDEEFASGSCQSPESSAATKIFASEGNPNRSGRPVVSLR